MKTLISVLVVLVVALCLHAASPEDIITQAIQQRRALVNKYGNGEDGPRVVEPHLLGTTTHGDVALQAWFLKGASASGDGPAWRTYLLSRITAIEVSDTPFSAPRPGFNPSGGKSFQSVKAKL